MPYEHDLGDTNEKQVRVLLSIGHGVCFNVMTTPGLLTGHDGKRVLLHEGAARLPGVAHVTLAPHNDGRVMIPLDFARKLVDGDEDVAINILIGSIEHEVAQRKGEAVRVPVNETLVIDLKAMGGTSTSHMHVLIWRDLSSSSHTRALVAHR